VLSLVRRTRLTPALALVMQLCMAVLSVSGLLHADDDAICNPEVVLHNHATDRIGAPAGVGQPPDHCVICHNSSLRSLIADADAPEPTFAVRLAVDTVDRARPTDLARRHAARAPPPSA
jgi:hypothetical protein